LVSGACSGGFTPSSFWGELDVDWLDCPSGAGGVCGDEAKPGTEAHHRIRMPKNIGSSPTV
jgi:hypothetical protein